MSIYEDVLKKWWTSYWWLRGIVAAITLSATVPTFTDLSNYEFLRAFHAVLIGWNELASIIGVLIGKIPLIPQISASAVNAVLFATSIGTPYIFAVFRNDSRSSSIAKVSVSVLWYFFMILLYLRIFDPDSEAFYISPDTFDSSVASYYAAILLLLSVFLTTLIALPEFRKGVVIAATFVAIMELLYIVRTPWIREGINAFACQQLENTQANCPPATTERSSGAND